MFFVAMPGSDAEAHARFIVSAAVLAAAELASALAGAFGLGVWRG
jgi:hypothetical protein